MIISLLKKDLQIFFKDRKGMLITFLLPIILITLFAFAFGGIGKKKSKPKPWAVLVVDQDSTATSIDLLSKLNAMPTIRLIPSEEADALDKVKKGKNIAALIVQKGFGEAVKTDSELPIDLQYDSAKTLQMQIVRSMIQGGFQYLLGKETPENTVRIQTTSLIQETSTKANPGLVQSVGGTGIMMLLFSIAAIGGGLLDEKDAGTLKRLLMTPIKPLHILFAKMMTAMVLSILQLVIMFVFAWLAFDLPIFTDMLSLSLLIFCIAFAVSSFGVFLASTVKTRQQLNGMSTVIIMLMSAIGGSMIPINMMPAFMQNIAGFSVNYWGIEGIFDIFWRQLPLVDILPKMGILLGIGTGMILISMMLFKRNTISVK